MYKIVKKRKLNDSVVLVEVEAAFIARKVLPGQFVIFRIDEQGERVPVTVADYDREKGTITLIVQTVGRSTMMLGAMEEGESLLDVVGPLGLPTELEGLKKVCVIGGGVGCAIAYPQAKALHKAGAHVDIIAGFRSKDIVIIEDEMRAVANNYYVMTDDGSYGEKGVVTKKLQELLDAGNQYDAVIAIGPVPMMKFVALTTKPANIKTIVSLNPIMIDGTGMCGGCRVTVGGQTKFACVDGPDFDGHQVDFDELIRRNAIHKEQETHDSEHCRLRGANNG
ncbi:MAG: sulfide/dihydroorotate dehydrogenase-like FAD/NAD-binding protein [Peptococcaceae bacterium]